MAENTLKPCNLYKREATNQALPILAWLSFKPAFHVEGQTEGIILISLSAKQKVNNN